MKKIRRELTGKLFEATPFPGEENEEIEDGLNFDCIAGQNYILGDDGKFYRVPREEMYKFLETMEEKETPDGVAVIFETPGKSKGKYFWAYDLKKKEADL